MTIKKPKVELIPNYVINRYDQQFIEEQLLLLSKRLNYGTKDGTFPNTSGSGPPYSRSYQTKRNQCIIYRQ